MSSNTITRIVVPAMGLAIALVAALIVYFVLQAWWSQPPAVLGFGDGPEQPVAFPHTVHVTDAGLDCQFCHRNPSTDEAATVPSLAQCQFCHDFNKIDGSESSSASAQEELAKIINSLDSLGNTVPPAPVDWVRVHRVPDHVQFVHAPHIQQGISCSTCHGDVGNMEVVEQVRNLKMRDCVDCHRDNNAPTDCTVCHY